MRREDAATVLVDGREHRCAGAVAEQYRRVATAGRLVQPARMHLSANQEDAFVLPGANPGVRNRQAVDEAAALIADINRGDVAEPELVIGDDTRGDVKSGGEELCAWHRGYA